MLNPLNRLLIAAIRGYQKTKRRKYSKCLHHPSCSNYGILALKKYGLFKAIKLTVSRYKDCHPFSNREYLDFP